MSVRSNEARRSRPLRLIPWVAFSWFAVVACSTGDDPTREAVERGAQPSTRACSGPYATDKTADNVYGVRSFGCWTNEDGEPQDDPDDVLCAPGCLAEARTGGLCTPLETGKVCEQRITWFVGGAGGRSECLARVRVKNVATGKSVIAVVLDYGPNCVVERRAERATFAIGGRVAAHLFGTTTVADDASVEVTPVAATTPLGPEG